MLLFTETNLAETLRKKCDEAKSRIWIVSPFVGDAKDVDCLLGPNWKNKNVDRKLIFDAISGSMPKSTLLSFFNIGIQIKSLHSVHAKIYIVDDWCLLTSANLTGTAFSKRYEIGKEIDSNKEIGELVDSFNKWWNLSETIKPDSRINEITTHNNFNQLRKLPTSDHSLEELIEDIQSRELKSGEYRIVGINIQHKTKSGRKCLILNCITSNLWYSIPRLVAIYDTELIEQYSNFMSDLGKSSLNSEQCRDLPEELKYISYMRERIFEFDKKHLYVRRFIDDISKYTSVTLIENYDGWEYDCATLPPTPTGIGWIDKAEEEEWLKNPYPTEAIPAKNYEIEVYICSKYEDAKIEDSEFERIKNYMLEDFYMEYSQEKFPKRKNRRH